MKKLQTTLEILALGALLGLSPGFKAFAGGGEPTNVSCGVPTLATLNSGEQHDYSFALKERSTVSVTWSLRSGSVSLDVLEESGDPIVAEEESGLATFEAEPGRYFLRFRAGADSSSYRFEVLYLEISPGCVAAVTCGLPVTDTIDAGEQQGYSFALQDRSTVSVTWSLRSGSASLDVLEESGDPIVAE